MQYILQIYRKYIPEKTGSAEVQHSITAYLMVCELDGELKKTIFYKLFPTLLHPASGVNLSTIGASIRCHLSQIEESPGFRFVLPNLVRSPCFLSFLALRYFLSFRHYQRQIAGRGLHLSRQGSSYALALLFICSRFAADSMRDSEARSGLFVQLSARGNDADEGLELR